MAFEMRLVRVWRMRSGSAQTLNAVRRDRDADVGFGGGGLLQAGGAARRSSALHMVSWSSDLPLEMRSRSRMSLTRRTRRSVLPIAISSICCIFSGRERSAPPVTQAERGAERGERGAELVRDGGDELVLHAIEGAALGGVGEGDDDADRLAALGVAVGWMPRSGGGRRTRRGSWCRPCARRPRR